jgi:hypothetical protein
MVSKCVLHLHVRRQHTQADHVAGVEKPPVEPLEIKT